jgi:non-homologous end joining protein Ku
MSLGTFEISINKGSIPLKVNVSMDKATDEKQFIGVHLGCPKCDERLKQRNVCVNSKCENLNHDIGYSEAKRLVCLDEKNAELQRAFSFEEYKKIFEKTKTTRIEIIGITDLKNINRIGVMSSYYLKPKDEKKDKAKTQENAYLYSMLKEALRNGYALIGKIMVRSKENLCVISDFGEALLLQNYYYADEIREIGDLKIADLTTKDRVMAKEWITGIVENEKFDFGNLRNLDKKKIIEKCLDLIKNKDIPVIEQKEERKQFANPFAIRTETTKAKMTEREKENDLEVEN